MEAARLDKWLWAARFFKTRSAATDAVHGGHVHVNGERAKPSKDVHAGDTVEFSVGSVQRTVLVTGIADKRGSATVAATLYAETPESIERGERDRQLCRLSRPLGADLGERPTKQARRRLDALRRAQRNP